MEKVSVVMSSFNTPDDFIDKSISSILGQTYSNIELIVICDGSRDEYNKLTHRYANFNIKFLLNEKNMGLAYSLNRAISLSTGLYIARMDSDDIALPNRIEKELHFIKKHKLDLCGMDAIQFGNMHGKKSVFFKDIESIKIQMLFRPVLIHPTVMGTKNFFKENPYNESFKYSQDFELWSRISNKYKIGICRANGIYYRIHNLQVSAEKKAIQEDYAKQIIKRNAMVLSESDESIEKCLLLLSGKVSLSNSDFTDLLFLIEHFIEFNNQKRHFKKKILRKVLNNRFFELAISNKIFINDKRYYRMLLKTYNFGDLLFKLKCKFSRGNSI